MKRRLLNCVMAAICIGAVNVAVATAQDPDEAKKLPAPRQSIKPADPPTTRCILRQDPNGWWLVSPQGKPFFSLGVCMLNQGVKKEEFDPAKPSYAALRHYDAPEAWAKANVTRLKSWGFTTAGGWSDYETLRRAAEGDLWMTPVLHLGSRSGVPWFDMWDEKNLRRVEELAEQALTPVRGNPQVIGHYSDNEIGWWNAILWKKTLNQPPSSGQRQRLIGLVREIYKNDWDLMVQDFEPQDAASWDELDRNGMLWLRPGTNGIRTMRRFLGLAADRYYQLMRETIHKFDPNSLYLGDRYQSFYYPEVAIAAARHVDAVSTNLNVSWNDGTFINAYLDTLHELSGKPVLVSEFYMAADENGSGNRNAVGGFPTVDNQKNRGEALSNTLRALARLSYVIGADWFQYYDEPPHGRKLDGEDYNFGLVDIHNRPYADVTAAFASVNLHSLKSSAPPPRIDASSGVPPAPAKPLGNFRFMTALKGWDRQRGFVRPQTPHPLGDLYVCWSPHAIYLATYVIDIVEPDYYRDSQIPEADRASWTIRLNGHDALSARVGCGKDPVTSNPELRVASLSGTYHDVRCITAIELPVAQFGKACFQAGDRISFQSTFTTFGRANEIDWQGEFTLSD
jgi:hypothetical protein